jgi:glyoxylase-like metal-dependent hydrolase (beta-lactamase superfamily II)
VIALQQRPPAACGRVARPPTDALAREIAGGLWSLQLPLCYVPVASMNAYLLRSRDGWIVWDCGSCLEPGWEAIVHALGQAGVRANDVTLLVISHAHADHRGLAAEFVARTGARLACSADPHPTVDVIRDPSIPLEVRRRRARREGIPEFAIDAIVDELPGMDTHYPDAEPDLVLDPGATLETLSGTWEVVALPGHSADQIGLWNPRLRHLISADLAFAGMVSYLEYGTRPDPQTDQLRSLDRALALGPELLLAGHGRPATDAGAVLRHSRRQVVDRVEAALAVIREPGLTGWDVAVALTTPGSLTDAYQRSISETLCVLEHLELHGRARSAIDDRGRRTWWPAGP